MIDSDASPVWTKVASMGRDLNPENELYTAGEEDSMLADADLDMDLGDEGEELQGLGGGEESLDEPPLDLDFELPAGEELEALGDLDGDAGGDLDFSLDLDAEGEAEVESEAEAAGDLDFDLDLDATVASDEAPLEADESMDFDLGGLGADAAADEVVADAPSVELDLSELEGEDEVGDLDLEAGLDFDFSVEEEGQDGAETLEGLSDEIADVDSDDLDLQLSTVKGEAADDGEGNINIEWDFTAAGEDPAALAEDDEPSIEFDLGAMGDEVAADEEADPDASINATLDVDRDELLAGELDDLSDISEVTPDPGSMADTKLDLAKAYIDMGDEDGARSILEEVLSEGDDGQQAKAHELLEQLPK
jgi:pilus assembly protein FimV